MSAYEGRVALVTGASSGIGAAVAEDLVKAGLIVVGAARRIDRIEALSDTLKDQPGRLVPKKLDVSNEKEIDELFKWIEKELGGVDVLINNAAVLVNKPIHEHTVEEIRLLNDVNTLGVIFASREAINGMIRRKVNDGYIININSVAGHNVPYVPDLQLGIYTATKHAMTAICKQTRIDVKQTGLKIRVTSISPGLVATEMTKDIQEPGKSRNFLSLTPDEVAKPVNFVLSMPKSVEVTEITIRPTGEVC